MAEAVAEADRRTTAAPPGEKPQQTGDGSTAGETATAARPGQPKRWRYVSLPYIKGVSEKIGRVLAQHDVKIANKSRGTLKEKLVKSKDPMSKERQKGVIYKTTCDCGAAYVGETGRPKSTRLKEHVADIKHGRCDTSPLANHWMNCKKDFDPSKAVTLAIENDWCRRIVRESIEIRQCSASLNQGVGKFSLNPIWDGVLSG